MTGLYIHDVMRVLSASVIVKRKVETIGGKLRRMRDFAIEWDTFA